MPVMENLLLYLKESVQRGDVTMSGLARNVGCSRQHLYGVINGDHQMSLSLAEKIAAQIGCEFTLKKKPRKRNLTQAK